MPRNISFALTTQQFRSRTKDVTRRLGWQFLQPGDGLIGCVRCMGLKKGESPEKLGPIRVTSVRREPLCRMVDEPNYGCEEVRREGFPDLSPEEFVAMFCEHMKCSPTEIVTRIEFEYLEHS